MITVRFGLDTATLDDEWESTDPTLAAILNFYDEVQPLDYSPHSQHDTAIRDAQKLGGVIVSLDPPDAADDPHALYAEVGDVRSLQFFNPNHDAKGEFASGGGGGFAHHQGKINELFGKLDKKAKGGKITESAAYHAGKELKEHVKAALGDSGMSAEEHAHLSHELESQTGMSSKKIAEGGTMATMHALQENFIPGTKISDHVAAAPKVSEGFALHQKSLNDAFAGLDSKAKNGVISEHNLYHQGKALTQAAKFVVADTNLTAGERAHINAQLKAHTGMTAEEMMNSSQIKVRDSLAKHYTPGKKIADMDEAKPESAPSSKPAKDVLVPAGVSMTNHTNNLDSISTLSDKAKAGLLLSKSAQAINSDKSLSSADKTTLSKKIESISGLTLDQAIYVHPVTIADMIRTKTESAPPSKPAEDGTLNAHKQNIATATQSVVDGASYDYSHAKALKASIQSAMNDPSLSPQQKTALSAHIMQTTGIDTGKIDGADHYKIQDIVHKHLGITPTATPKVSPYSPIPHPEWVAKLSSLEVSAIKSYTGNAYFEINKGLRNGNPPNSVVKRIDSAFEKAPPSPGRVVLRAINTDGLPAVGHDLVGKIYTDRGYMSTTKNTHHVFTGSQQFRITVPPGAKELDVSSLSHHPGENELLLPRDSKFKVTSAVPNPHGGWVYEMTYLTPESAMTAAEPRTDGEEAGDSGTDFREDRFTAQAGDGTWSDE